MKNKKLTLTIIGVIALILITIGLSYAYWLITKTQTNQNLITSACLDISMTSEKNDINLGQQYPISDADGLALTPYEFTVTNNCNVALDYQIALEATGTESSALKATSLKVALDDTVALLSSKETTTTTVSGAYKSYILGYGTLGPKNESNASATHTLKIWIDENAPISERNKTFASKVTVTIGQGIEAPIIVPGTLAYDITNKYGGESSITEFTGDFSASIVDGEGGLYKAQDDLGESYYFRGDTENNYVQLGTTSVYSYKEPIYETGEDGFETIVGYEDYVESGNKPFASLNECKMNYENGEACYVYDDDAPMYWRIMRVNGDGTVRLIYAGVEKVHNGTTYSAYMDIGGVNFSFEEFMRYETNGFYEAINNLYENNLKTQLNNYITDNVFCYDTEPGDMVYYDSDQNETTKENATYMDGSFLFVNRLNAKSPTLMCVNPDNKYTTNTTIGNGLLNNPIGLITADEVMHAGVGTYSYLYDGTGYTTMTPNTIVFIDIDFLLTHISSSGQMSTVSLSYGGQIIIRPVINLKVDVSFTGDGSYETPYVIGTN